ncbi:MAG: ABC transporter substrate-binding protein, partial [Rhodospirillaceae bacterium]
MDYASGKPLAADVSAPIRDCRNDGALTLPLITWGADIVTLQAAGQGGATTTQSGSEFDKAGLTVSLQREDNFLNQLKSYMACETPFLRATLGMANLVADLTEADPRTKMVAIYQHSWSAGGDAMVVREGIDRPEDLKGKAIALQRGGPHVDYLLTILRDAGIGADEVTLKWTDDLVGPDGSTPMAALLQDGAVDAAMVILPDALALTSGGGVGTGAEGSLKGGRILLST